MRDSGGEDPTPLTGEPGVRSNAGDGQASGNDASALHYSPEQRELLEQGLRLLARLAVRAYLRSESGLRRLWESPDIELSGHTSVGLSGEDEGDN